MNITFDTLKTIISYLGAIGIGSIGTLFINNYFLSLENKKKLLFEARVKAYSGLVSRFFNLFNELDINRLGEALRFVKINELLSEAYLLGSSDFVEKLGKFKPTLLAFHSELDDLVRNKKKDDSTAMIFHKKLLDDIGAIYNQMRSDLFIEEVEIEAVKIKFDSVDLFKLRGLSEEEITQRHNRSVEEALEVQKLSNEIQADILAAPGPVSEEQVKISESSYKELIPQIENKAIDKLASSLGVEVRRQVYFAGLPLQFDGLVVDNDSKLLRFIEVKIFPNLPKNRQGKVMSYAIIESLRKTLSPIISTISKYLKNTDAKMGWKYVLTIAIVLNSKNDFVKLRNRIEELGKELSVLGNEGNLEINYVFYNLKNVQLDLE